MTRGIKRHRRRTSYVVLLVAFAALGVWASYALAGNDKGQVTVNVEKYNDDCGDSQGKKVIGTDTFKRSGDTLSVTHTVHGADPGNYDLYLYDAESCARDRLPRQVQGRRHRRREQVELGRRQRHQRRILHLRREPVDGRSTTAR